MKLFEGKSPTERNKIIVALVLGVLSVLALGNMIFAPFSGKKTINVTLSPTPASSATPNKNNDSVITALPKQSEIDDIYTRTPVVMQSAPGAPDAGRNIFAFYEPPIPTPFSPTPYVTPKVIQPKTPIPIPVPTPDIFLSSINKQSVYAGEKGFVLEVGGDKFTPDTPIWFGGTPLPTRYISPQQLTAEIPENYLAAAGQRNIEVRSADGKSFSNLLIFNVQQAPLPQFQYLGIVSRKRGNNDTAYIQEQGKTLPSSVRLNDLIGGRFRLVSISPAKLLVQDIQLGFLAPYSIDLVKGAGQTSTTTNQPNRIPPNQKFPPDGSTFNPNPQCPPGIPCNNYKPYIQPTPQQKSDEDVDDDGDN